MNTVKKKISFKDVVHRVQKLSTVRIEWKQFTTEEKIDFLKALADPSCQNLIEKHEVNNICSNDEKYVRECLKVSLENELNFWSLFEYIEQTINKNKLIIVNDTKNSLKFLYNETLITLIEKENLEILSEILSRLHQKKTTNENSQFYVDIHNGITQTNSKIFITTCRKDHIDLIRILVNHGCRLSSSHIESETKVQSFYNKYLQLPKIFPSNDSTIEQNPDIFEGEDEVSDLHLLRMMAKPSYILACYEHVVHKTFPEGDLSEDEGHKCTGYDMRSLHTLGVLHSQMPINYCTCHHEDCENREISHIILNENIHYCPDNPNFNPSLNCRTHLECNDPIFRCFDLAKLAIEHAEHIPEYREEYEEISNQCRQLSVHLLAQCTSTEEVKTLLKESAGSTKYFRFAKDMEYPRLRLAIEHNHMEFAGHMFCQQMLRKQWHGTIEWQGSSFTFRILHILLQVILAPIYVSIFLFLEIRKSIRLLNNTNGTDLNEQPPTSRNILISKVKKKINGLKQNLNIPLNRLLIFTGYYFIFVVMVLTTILEKEEEIANPCSVEFRGGYFFLTIYVISMFWDDIQTLKHLKSLRTYFKFWRVFDLILHIFLIIALTCKLLRTVAYPFNSLVECVNENLNISDVSSNCINVPSNCNDENISEYYFTTHHNCYICSKITETSCEMFCSTRQILDDWEGIFLAIATTQSIIRWIYWLQLSERIGPLVINISRVIMDIFSVAGSYVLIALAFTFGLVFVLAYENYYKELKKNDVNGTIPYHVYATSFKEILIILAWSVLDPGSKSEELNIKHYSSRSNIAGILVMLYQIMIIIVLLNLLIAVMNATVQKCQDRKQLYWKFTRTSIWIEYFDRVSGIPTPFSILNLFRYMVHGIVQLIKVCRKNKSNNISMNESGLSAQSKICDSVNWDDRKKHANLMLKLIQRYNVQFQKGKDDMNENFQRDFMLRLNSVLTSQN